MWASRLTCPVARSSSSCGSASASSEDSCKACLSIPKPCRRWLRQKGWEKLLVSQCESSNSSSISMGPVGDCTALPCIVINNLSAISMGPADWALMARPRIGACLGCQTVGSNWSGSAEIWCTKDASRKRSKSNDCVSTINYVSSKYPIIFRLVFKTLMIRSLQSICRKSMKKSRNKYLLALKNLQPVWGDFPPSPFPFHLLP